MKKAIHLAYKDGWEDQLRDAKAAGFRYVEWGFNTAHMALEAPECIAEKLMGAMEECGVHCVTTHLPFYSLFDDAEELDETVEKAIKDAICLSGMLGASAAAYHPRSSTKHNFSVRRAEAALHGVMPGYLELAEKYGTRIAIENLAVFPDHPDLLFYGSRYEDLVRIVDHYASPLFGICWDTGHANLMHLDQYEILKEIGHRLIATHVHDNCGFHDDHSFPSLGTADFSRIMPAFREIGYDGPLMLELKLPPPRVRRSYQALAFDLLCWLEELAEGEVK